MVLLLQLPIDDTPFPFWSETISQILNIFLALTLRGYLLFVLLGFMVYLTGLSDGFAKTLVVLGIILYLVGPHVLHLVSGIAGIEAPTLTEATLAWAGFSDLTDSELIALLLSFGDTLAAIGMLSGAILYFVPSSSELNSKGRSLMVRALMLAPVLVFLHVSPWL